MTWGGRRVKTRQKGAQRTTGPKHPTGTPNQFSWGGAWNNPQLTKEFRAMLKNTELQLKRCDWPGSTAVPPFLWRRPCNSHRVFTIVGWFPPHGKAMSKIREKDLKKSILGIAQKAVQIVSPPALNFFGGGFTICYRGDIDPTFVESSRLPGLPILSSFPSQKTHARLQDFLNNTSQGQNRPSRKLRSEPFVGPHGGRSIGTYAHPMVGE